MNHRPTDDLEQLLANARPTVDELTDQRYASLTREMARETVHAERVRSGRVLADRRRVNGRRRLLAVGLAAALAVPATAWASGFLAQTGWFGAPGMTENDTSEWIDVCAEDFPEYFRTQIPVPTDAAPEGWTWQQVGDDILEAKAAGNAADCAESGVNQQVTGLKSDYYWWAQDTWMCRAVEAYEAGDEEGFRANAALAADTVERLGDLGVLGDDGWRPIQDGLRAGDFDVVSQFYDANNAAGGCR